MSSRTYECWEGFDRPSVSPFKATAPNAQGAALLFLRKQVEDERGTDGEEVIVTTQVRGRPKTICHYTFAASVRVTWKLLV